MNLTNALCYSKGTFNTFSPDIEIKREKQLFLQQGLVW